MFKYITIPPGGPLAVRESHAPLTLAEMQSIVGGYIELFLTVETPDGPIDCYCNEEGKLNGLLDNVYVPAVQDIVVGTIFLVSNDGQGSTTSLTDALISRVHLVDTGVRTRGTECVVLGPGEQAPAPRKLYALLIDGEGK